VGLPVGIDEGIKVVGIADGTIVGLFEGVEVGIAVDSKDG
jgi:hypothetical protein